MTETTMNHLSEDIVFRVLGYVTFTERERYSNLNNTFNSAVKEWYRLETSFPNRYTNCGPDHDQYEEEFDRKYNIKKILLNYSNIKRVDTTKLRNNSLRETSDLLNYWSKKKKLIHIKPCNDYNWIRVLREPLLKLFKSCPLVSIDVTSQPPSCFNDMFLGTILPGDQITAIKTNFLQGFKLKTLLNLRKLTLDTITESNLKKLPGLEQLTITSNQFTLTKKHCEALQQFANLKRLHVNCADCGALATLIGIIGHKFTHLCVKYFPDGTTRWQVDYLHGESMDGLDYVSLHVTRHCPNMIKCTLGDAELDSFNQ